MLDAAEVDVSVGASARRREQCPHLLTAVFTAQATRTNHGTCLPRRRLEKLITKAAAAAGRLVSGYVSLIPVRSTGRISVFNQPLAVVFGVFIQPAITGTAPHRVQSEGC